MRHDLLLAGAFFAIAALCMTAPPLLRPSPQYITISAPLTVGPIEGLKGRFA